MYLFLNKACCNQKSDRECVLYIIEAAAMYATGLEENEDNEPDKELKEPDYGEEEELEEKQEKDTGELEGKKMQTKILI
jgi:hypothetical protein